jgi:adenosylhomocysteinase
VVCGYGWCGRGLASRAHGMGAHVIVTEVDPTRALEALMDGYRVMPLAEAVQQADVIITVTGDLNVVDAQHFRAMKDGCIVANSGHFNDEINIPALVELASAHRQVRPFVEEYELRDGRRVYLLADGRLLNLASAEGHPAAVMDMSFANQVLAAVYIAQNADKLSPGVYDVPREIDQEVARLKLASLGVRIDELTEAQRRYLASWDTGT